MFLYYETIRIVQFFSFTPVYLKKEKQMNRGSIDSIIIKNRITISSPEY